MAFTLTELKSFVEPARETFCGIIPDSDFLRSIPIHVLSNRTWDKKRAEIIRRLNSTAGENDDTASSSGESIIGVSGEAEIIIREEKDKQYFIRTIWHELGHVYAMRKENPGQELWKITITREANYLDGYIAWKEFVAEALANLVAEKTHDYFFYGQEDYYLTLHDHLEYAFAGPEMLPYYLGFYAAQLLTNPGVKEAERLKTFDFSALDDLNPCLHDPVEDFVLALKEQMKKEKFWETDKDLIGRLKDSIGLARFMRLLCEQRGEDCIVRDPEEVLEERNAIRSRRG